MSPFIRLLPVHGGMHSLSVSTYALGTRSAPRRYSCTVGAASPPFALETVVGSGWPLLELFDDMGGCMPSPTFIFCHMKRPENILPARQSMEKLASSRIRSAYAALVARQGCVRIERCSHSSALNLLAIQFFGV